MGGRSAWSFRILVVMGAGIAAGCAAFQPGLLERSSIERLLRDWKSALVAKDIDRVMSYYIEETGTPEPRKDAIRGMFEDSREEGGLNDVVVNVEDATIKVDGKHATVLPVAVCAPTGSASIRLTLAKIEGRWWIVDTR